MMPSPNLSEDQYENLNSRSSISRFSDSKMLEGENRSKSSTSISNKTQFPITTTPQQNQYGQSSANHPDSQYDGQQPSNQQILTKAELRKVNN